MRHYYVLWSLLALLAAACVFSLVRVENVQHHQNDALRSIICFVEHREKVTLPPKERQQAIEFWAKALADAHLKPCS